jgi:predicted MFS family arabinose efflux permease
MRSLPHHVTTLMEALSFGRERRDGLRAMNDSEWRDILSHWGLVRLALPLRQRCGDDLPFWVREQIDRYIDDNTERFRRIQTAYREIAAALGDAGVEHVVLKGFAQWPEAMESPRVRAQSDIDLYCPPESILRARDALVGLGYESAQGGEHQDTDHLPAMSRKSDFEWRGNYFDADLPVGVDLHFRFWSKALTRLDPSGLDEFWARRVERQVGDLRFPALNQTDSLAFGGLHALRHLLLGGLLPYHVYEIAWFLHASADNGDFWKQWREQHDESLRPLEAVSFRMARDWFDCRLPQEAQEEVGLLPAPVQKWFEDFGNCALADLIHPNKDALWLHLSLLESASDKRAVFFSRLFPTAIPPVQAVARWPLRIYRKFSLHVISRVSYHLRLLPATLWDGLRWWWSGKELGKQFWTFYAASFCFDFGMFIFFFLFNLYLLDCGYTEKFVGQVTGVGAIGSIAGTIPAGLMAQRYGLRKTLLASFALVSAVSALRATFVWQAPQLLLAFLAGAVTTVFAVSLSPALAQLTNDKNRAFGFSIIFSFGIGDGILGSLFGGHLPGWLGRIAPMTSHAHIMRSALLIASGITAVALWPTSRLRFTHTPAPEKKFYHLNPFLRRYLPAIAIWTLATGAFSPFANVYFSQYLRMPVERIGAVFSASQFSQVIAILAAPLIFRKFGLIAGIMYMQIATAVALGCLSVVPGTASAALVYVGFMAFQWMSEPGMYSLLMSEVTPAERSSASAMNFLVISAANAIAAFAGGSAFVHFGYPAVLTMSAGVAFVAALVFRLSLGGREQTSRAPIGLAVTRHDTI